VRVTLSRDLASEQASFVPWKTPSVKFTELL
jgi:hypothetical protein